MDFFKITLDYIKASIEHFKVLPSTSNGHNSLLDSSYYHGTCKQSHDFNQCHHGHVTSLILIINKSE